jgi:hypothetical protein
MSEIEFAPLTFDLLIGHTDSNQVRHNQVTFGKRVNGKTFFAIDDDPQSSIPTQYTDLLLRAAITRFGTLKMPVALSVLLNLDSIDRDDLSEAFNRFSVESLGEKQVEYLSDSKVKLAIGYERNGLVYDVVEFGHRLTGMDEVAADREKLSGIRRVCFLAGRQVVRLSQSEGESALDGEISLNIFEGLDAVDIEAIRVGSEVWRNSFRRPGRGTVEVGAGPERSTLGGVH